MGTVSMLPLTLWYNRGNPAPVTAQDDATNNSSLLLVLSLLLELDTHPRTQTLTAYN